MFKLNLLSPVHCHDCGSLFKRKFTIIIACRIFVVKYEEAKTRANTKQH